MIGSHFTAGVQQDAHEFMRSLTANMHLADLRAGGNATPPPHSQENTGLLHSIFGRHFMRSLTANMHLADLRAGRNATPPPHSQEHAGLLHGIFGGHLSSQVQCESCNSSTNTYDAFLDLSLEMNQAATVLDALELVANTDFLEGDKKCECSKCGKKTCATNCVILHRTPRVLQLHLNRFGRWSTKIGHHVTFPESLAMDAFTSQGKDHKDNPFAYGLYAVIVHIGSSVRIGHYVAYVKDPRGRWFQLC